jgi:hypothetical protein
MSEFFSRLAGTLNSFFRIGSVRLKDGSGTLVVRNAGDTANAGVEVSALKVTGGTPASGKVLTSDANGNATWASAGGGNVTVRDIDGTPSISASTIEFTNGSVQDQGGGVARVTVGGGSTFPLFMPDARPASALSSYDEEFQGMSSLSASWTVSDSSHYELNDTGLVFKSSGGWAAKQCPTSKFQVWTKISINSLWGNYVHGALRLFPAANTWSGGAYGYSLAIMQMGSEHKIIVMRYQNGSWNTNLEEWSKFTSGSRGRWAHVYIKAIYNPSDGALEFWTGDDGIGWNWVCAYTCTGLTHFNLYGESNGTPDLMTATFPFLRVSTTLTARADYMRGRLVNLPAS